MKIIENAKYMSKNCYRTWKLWKCSLFSELKTLEAFTIFGSENLGSVHYFRFWKFWKCSLFSDLKPWKWILISDLKILEVFTIFGYENPGSVHYLRIWKPWKCLQFSDLNILEVFTICGSENPGSVHYFRIWKPWKCIILSDLKTVEVLFSTQFCRGVRGAPNEGDGRGGEYSQWILGDNTISGDDQGWVDARRVFCFFNELLHSKVWQQAGECAALPDCHILTIRPNLIHICIKSLQPLLMLHTNDFRDGWYLPHIHTATLQWLIPFLA